MFSDNRKWNDRFHVFAIAVVIISEMMFEVAENMEIAWHMVRTVEYFAKISQPKESNKSLI